MDSKWLLSSKSIVANLMISVPLVLHAVGVDVTPEFLGDATKAVEALYGLVAIGLGIWGRYSASGTAIWTFKKP